MRKTNDNVFLLEGECGVFANALSDTAFKKIFGSEEYKDVTIGLINSFIPERPIVDIEFDNVEIQGQTDEERRTVIDLLCTDQDGAKYIVELQKATQKYFRERMIYYASRIISGKVGVKGIPWDYLVDQVYVLAFTNFAFTDVIDDDRMKDTFVLKYETVEATMKSRMPHSPAYYFFDLKRFNKKVEEIAHSEEKWLFLIRNSAKLRQMPAEFSGDHAVEKYFTASRIAAFSPEENEKYNSDMRNEWDTYNEHKFFEEKGRTEGEAKGRAEGKAEGKAEVARNMLNRGIDLQVIAECTGFSIEEINGLR